VYRTSRAAFPIVHSTTEKPFRATSIMARNVANIGTMPAVRRIAGVLSMRRMRHRRLATPSTGREPR